MKNRIMRSAILATVLPCMLSYASVSLADESGVSNKALLSSSGTIIQAINNLVGGYGASQLTASNASPPPSPLGLFYQSSDSVYNQLIGNLVEALIDPSQAGLIAPYNSKNKNPTLNVLNSNALTSLLTVTNIGPVLAQSAQVPGPLPVNPNEAQQLKLPYTSKTGANNASTANFDVNSLILPLQYTQQQQAQAMTFINFATGLAAPIPVVNLGSLTDKQIQSVLSTNGDYQIYLVSQRSLVAMESMGIGNLYYLYTMRIPQDTSNIPGSTART